MFFFSDRLVLRMYGAKLVTEEEARNCTRMVDRLRQRASFPCRKWRCRLTNSRMPSPPARPAARGRRGDHGDPQVHAREELEGVLAHELAHVKNRDMLISTIAAGFAGASAICPVVAVHRTARQ